MFKKKNEFRPDRTGSGVLGKLYMTRQQRQKALIWLLYIFVLVALSVLQDVLLWRLRIHSASTDLVSAGILLLCLMLPTDHCAVFSLVASTAFYFSGSAAGPYVILFLTGIGLGLNILRYSFLQKGILSTFLCAGTGMLLYELLIFLMGLFLGHTTAVRFPAFLLTAGLSICVMPLLYPIFLSIGNIGGESWKE